MGKQGPCYHCGVTSTPLWRNGPPNKPILCNACGSRWRTKGTLINYTPLHSRAEPVNFEGFRVSKEKNLSIKSTEAMIIKRKFDNDIAEHGVIHPRYNQGFSKWFDEDTSNRSSSGSVISNDESCAQYGSADASDLTGPSQPIAWDTTVPSKKRTCVNRPKPSSVEKLTKDLYTIWHEQQSSCLSEEDLLFETGKSMVSVEIGHGSVLIRHPNSRDREESEVSSLTLDQNQQTLVSMDRTSLNIFKHTGINLSSRVNEILVKPVNQGTENEKIQSDNVQLEKLQILAHHNSPLCYIDMQDLKYKNGIDVAEAVGGFNAIATSQSASRALSNGQHQKFAGGKVKIKSPGRSLDDSSYDEKEPFDQDGSIFSAKSLFSSKNYNDSSYYSEESSDQDLLLHVPSNSSFPLAELLPPTSFDGQL